MKKFLIIFGLVLGISSLAYATMFCCPPDKTKEQCCAERGKMYCENDGKCRTRCRDVTPPECIGGCINPKGECCLWCPTAEVCAYKGLCQRIVEGCYTCDTCAPDCPSPKCLNEKGICCDSCPRTCPEGQCLVNVDGCYECRECETETTETTEITELEDKCVGKDKYKDCCECNPDTGEYDINCTTTEEKPECCNNTPYEGCPERKVRNQTTCECECELTMEWCFENGGAALDSNQCVCMGCKEGLEWCNDDCYPKCPDGQIRAGDCECYCPAGEKDCGGWCCPSDNTCGNSSTKQCCKDSLCCENGLKVLAAPLGTKDEYGFYDYNGMWCIDCDGRLGCGTNVVINFGGLTQFCGLNQKVLNYRNSILAECCDQQYTYPDGGGCCCTEGCALEDLYDAQCNLIDG